MSRAEGQDRPATMKGGQLQLHAFTIPMAPLPYFDHHEHDYHEFFFCLSGAGTQYRERRELAMSEGDLFVYPAGIEHMGAGKPGTDCVGVVVYVHQRAFAEASEGDLEARAMLQSVLAYGRDCDARLLITDQTRAAIGPIMQQMADEVHHRQPGYRSALKAGMHGVLLALSRDQRVGPSIQQDLQQVLPHHQIAEVCRYLERNFRNPVTVSEMANLAGMSRSHFHAMFKRETGMPLTHYVQSLRVAEAERLLADTDQSVLQIATDSGFSSLSHFYAVFGRRRGCSPNAFRERVHDGVIRSGTAGESISGTAETMATTAAT